VVKRAGRLLMLEQGITRPCAALRDAREFKDEYGAAKEVLATHFLCEAHSHFKTKNEKFRAAAIPGGSKVA